MRHHGPHCGCNSCKTIVHPTEHCCVNQYSESQVNHVHPTHTTIMHHHTVKNNHLYPHSTSVQDTTNSVDQYGGSFPVPTPPGQVAGATTPPGTPGGPMGPGMPGSQVMGATNPGYGPGHGGHVMGAQSPHGGHHGWKKPAKWC